MKVLFVSDLYPIVPDRSIPAVVEDFALAFKDFGCEVEVVRPNFLLNTVIRGHKILKSAQYDKKGIKIHNKNFFLPFFIVSDNFLEKFKDFDLIISHLPCGHIFADKIAQKYNIAHISIVHQSDWRVLSDFKYKFYFKKRLEKALLNSQLVGARNMFLKEKTNADFILPSFVEKRNIVQNRAFQSDSLKIITLSKLIKRKNINLVIEALAQAEFDFEYNIWGEGPEKKRLLNLIKKYNLQNRIKINDFIPHEKIFEKLDENNVFILPSVNETFGLSYLEALSRGLIVVASCNTGVDGIISDNINGFLTNPSKDSILNTLNKINALSVEKKRAMYEKSIQTAKNYEKDKIMTKYFETIKKIL